MRDLSKFSPDGYNRGRNFAWQFSWFLVSHLFFQKFWMPTNFRPIILRFFGAKIGRDVLIRQRVKIHWPWKLEIGDHSWLGEGVWLLNLEQITIGSSVCISQDAFICTGSHKSSSPNFEFDNRPISIEDGAWICARSIVLRGSIIAQGQVIPAGQVFKGGGNQP